MFNTLAQVGGCRNIAVKQLHIVLTLSVSMIWMFCSEAKLACTNKPTPKLRFQKQKSPKSGTQHNFPHHISKHIPTLIKKIWLSDFTGKSQGNVHCAPPLIPRSWERCLPITLDCPPVQSYHNSTVNCRVHASDTFLVNGDERPLLMVCFLIRLEMSPFFWRKQVHDQQTWPCFHLNTKHFHKWRPHSKDLFGLQVCG